MRDIIPDPEEVEEVVTALKRIEAFVRAAIVKIKAFWRRIRRK